MDMPAQATLVPDFAPAAKASANTKIVARDVNVYYGEKHALKSVSVDIPERSVMAFIGPSGCGKSTFLRCINRMNDTIPICRVTGKIEIDGQDIYDPALDVVQLARARWHGLPEAESVPQIRVRERGLWPSHPWADDIQGGARGDRRLEPEARGIVRGGQGSVARFRDRAFRRPAAAPVHCACDRGEPRASFLWTSHARPSIRLPPRGSRS